MFKAGTRAEFLDQLQRGSHRTERRDFEDFYIIKPPDDALILILTEQGFEHSSGLGAIFGEHVPLAHIVRAITARQGWLIEGNMADQIERIEVFAHLLQQRLQQQAFFGQLVDDEALALLRSPAAQKLIETGLALADRLAAVIAQ